MTIFNLTIDHITALLLIFVRIGAIFLTAPVISSSRIPLQIRAALSIVIAFMLQPLVAPGGVHVGDSLFVFALLLGKEAIIGLLIGYAANLIFSIVQMTGEMQDIQAGYGFAGVVDPNISHGSAILGQFQMVLMWLIFFVVNGHHVMLSAIADSFSAVPVGKFNYNPEIAVYMFHLAGTLILIALRIGAPVIGAVLLTDLALGLIQRTAPQLNLIAVGFQVKTTVAILALMLALPFIVSLQGGLVPFMNRIVHDVIAFAR